MKLIDDTLKKPDGRWDKQAILFVVSFFLSALLGITNTVVSYVSEITNNATADNVFNSFMLLTGALSGANIFNKIADRKTKSNQTE